MVGVGKVALAKKLIPDLNKFWPRNLHSLVYNLNKFESLNVVVKR